MQSASSLSLATPMPADHEDVLWSAFLDEPKFYCQAVAEDISGQLNVFVWVWENVDGAFCKLKGCELDDGFSILDKVTAFDVASWQRIALRIINELSTRSLYDNEGWYDGY